MKNLIGLVVAGTVLLTGVLTVNTQNTPAPENGVSVTVYNQGTALIQDRRTFTFTEGVNTINFTDVAAGIDATSVNFSSLTDPNGTTVLEQNYLYDLVDTTALMRRYIDKTIEFRVEVAPGEETVISYTVAYSWPPKG